MTGKEAIKHVVEFCHTVTNYYINDLSDTDLMVRSVPNANHIAWQLGHLISSEAYMLTELGRTPPELPTDFVECYTNETATSDDAAKFHGKDEYIALMDKCKAATLAAIDATRDADLDKPSPESMREYAPTTAAALTLLGTHWLMHAGQFVPIRRKLGKKPLF